MSNVPTIHRALAAAYLALAAVSFFFAGLSSVGETTWTAHENVGSLLVVLATVLLVLAIVGRREAREASVWLGVLTIAQAFLGGLGDDVGVLGGLHALNSVVILVVAFQAMRGEPLRL